MSTSVSSQRQWFQIDSSIHEVNRESMLSERRREKSETKSGGVDS